MGEAFEVDKSCLKLDCARVLLKCREICPVNEAIMVTDCIKGYNVMLLLIVSDYMNMVRECFSFFGGGGGDQEEVYISIHYYKITIPHLSCRS